MNYKQRYNTNIERIYPDQITDLGYKFYIGEYLEDVELNTGKVLTDYVDITLDLYSNNYLIESYSLSGGTLEIDNQKITINIDTTNFNSGDNNMIIIKLYIESDKYDEMVFLLGKSYND